MYNDSIGQSGENPGVLANSNQEQVRGIGSSGACLRVVPRYFHFQNMSSLSALESVRIAEQLVVAMLPYLDNFQKLRRFL